MNLSEWGGAAVVHTSENENEVSLSEVLRWDNWGMIWLRV